MEVVELLNPEERAGALSGLLPELKEWFGIEEVNREFVREVRSLDTFVFKDEAGAILGLISLTVHFGTTGEIHWAGVRPDRQRRGIGRQLYDAAERRLKEKGCRFVVLSTLSQRSPDEGYRRTRAFWEAMGFAPLFEYQADDPVNPLLVMMKTLGKT